MKTKKQIVLSFIDWFRPGYKAGGTISSFGNFVDYLGNDFNFKIVTRNTDYLEKEPFPNISSNTWLKTDNYFTYYISQSSLNLKKIKKLLQSTPYDFVYINGMFSFFFSVLPLFLMRNKGGIINPHGMLSPQAFSVKKGKKKLFLKVCNILNLYKNVTFHVANKDEEFYVKKNITKYKKIVIANQLPRKIKSETNLIHSKTKNKITNFVSLTRISKEKGILQMVQTFKDVNEPVIVDIYGAIYDKAYWNECLKEIDLLPDNVSFTYKGIIPSSEVPSILINYNYFILLSLGENFGHAILEGLSAGCPVLISDQTPWKQLKDKQIGWDVELADREQIKKALNYAINMGGEEYKKWSLNAFQYAKAFCEKPEVLEANKQLFN